MVDDGVEAISLINAAKAADKVLIADVSVFDVFRGAKAEAQLGAGKKSVAIAVRLEPKEATLTDKDIEAISARIIGKVGDLTGAVLRG